MPGSTAKIVGCAAVSAAVGALSFGLPAVNHAIPAPRQIPASPANADDILGSVTTLRFASRR